MPSRWQSNFYAFKLLTISKSFDIDLAEHVFRHLGNCKHYDLNTTLPSPIQISATPLATLHLQVGSTSTYAIAHNDPTTHVALTPWGTPNLVCTSIHLDAILDASCSVRVALIWYTEFTCS